MAAKHKKHRKHRIRIFYPIYWGIVILSAAAIGMMMCDLWQLVEDYEASMPKYVAQDVERIFTERDFATMYEYDDVSKYESEGKEAYVEYMNRLTSGYDITCKEKYSADSNEKVYQVKYGDHKLATYTLCKSGELSEHGNELWKLKEIRSSVIESHEYQLIVPETSTVYANGQKLEKDAVIESGLQMTDNYLPEGYERTLWEVYSVSSCFSMPKFEVTDEKGRGQKIIPGDEGRMTVRVNYDDEQLRPHVEEDVFNAAQLFAMFTSDDRSRAQVERCILDDSKAYTYIRGFDGGWFMPHRDVEFLNMRSDQYVEYADGTFSCNVYFDYRIIYRNAEELYPTAYTFFFAKEDEKWLIFDFATVS